MIAFFHVLIFALFFIVNCGKITELTKESFSDFIHKHEYCLILFYSEDCTACVTIIERLEKLSDELSNIKVNPAKINGERSIKLLEEYQINDYPTLKFFRSRIPEDYYGGREEHEILEWLKDQISYPIITIEDKKQVKRNNINEILAKDDVIYLFYGLKESSEFYSFYNVADFNRASGKYYFLPSNLGPISAENFEGIFNETFDIDSIKDNSDYGSKSWLVCLRRFEDKIITYNGSLSNKKDLWEFVKKNRIPLFGEISSRNYVKYSDIEFDLIWLLVPMENGKGEESIRPYIPLFTQISQEFSENYRVVWLDTSEHSSHLSTVLLVEPEMLPTVAVAKSRPYILPPNTPIEYSTIKKFIQDIELGKIEPKLRSEPVPLYHEDDKLIKVVGSNFNSLVLQDKENDWLLLLTTPFCQPCIDTEEIIKKIQDALSIQGNSKIKFGNIDISENDLPKDEFYSNSIPSLLFFKKSQGLPIHFSADEISYMNIKEFIINSTSVDSKHYSFVDPVNATKLVVTIFPEFEQFSDEYPTQEQIELVENSIRDEL